MNVVGVIYRKEFLDIIRDKKTLLYAVVVPTIFIPLLMMAFGNLLQAMQTTERQRTVVIAAAPEVQDAYRQMVFEWFQKSDVGVGIQTAQSPLGTALSDSQLKDYIASLPPNITTSQEAFDAWAMSLREPPKEKVAEAKQLLEAKDLDAVSADLQEAALQFHEVVIKGYALVEFVDPATQPWGAEEIAQASSVPFEMHYKGQIIKAINERTIQAGLDLPQDWEAQLADPMTTVDVKFLYDSTIGSSNEAFDRIRTVIAHVSEVARDNRLRAKDLPSSFFKPIKIAQGGNVATPSRMSSEVFGTFLPYLVIVFAYLGGLFPAIDLGAGEKERFTLETLLLSTATRFEIALAKYLVILSTSLLAAFMGVASMILSFQFVLPAELRALFDVQISSTQIFACALLAVPPSALFAGLFLSLSIYARSFKEAQNYIAPLQFLLLLPALAPALPNLQMSAWLALVPLVNVSMLAKDFLKGDIRWDYYGLTLLSCTVLAGLSLWYCLRKFQDERVLFRS